jgi:hypothetical protein
LNQIELLLIPNTLKESDGEEKFIKPDNKSNQQRLGETDVKYKKKASEDSQIIGKSINIARTLPQINVSLFRQVSWKVEFLSRM